MDNSATRHGDETLASLIVDNGDLPVTPSCLTGGGGQHVFFWSPRAVPNSVDKVGDGLDIRGEGGYVVAAPSRHRSGRAYEWEATAHPADVTLAECPPWLLELAGRYRTPALVENAGAGDFIIGRRNNALTQMAGHMRRPGIGPKAILAALLVINETQCKPPLDPAEVRQIAESIGKAQPGAPIKAAPSHEDPYPMLDANDMATELPPTPWLCEPLKIAPGGITIVGGEGFGGKTISMQSLALSIASGRKLWGEIPVVQGRAIHLDYEQGRPLTQRRYQRLAKGMGLSWSDLQASGAFGVSCLPRGRLSDPDALKHVIRICTGAKVCIVDSFRRAFPKAQENSSEAADYLDMLQQASDVTGCCMIVIMHTRKASEDTNIKSSLRGSSALSDASQSLFMLVGEKGKPTQVHHLKERVEGETVDMFGLRVKDVTGPDGDYRWGLAVEYVHTADVQAAYHIEPKEDEPDIAGNLDALAALVARIIDLVSGEADGMVATTIRYALHRSASDVAAALAEGVRAGALRVEGRGPTATYSVE